MSAPAPAKPASKRARRDAARLVRERLSLYLYCLAPSFDEHCAGLNLNPAASRAHWLREASAALTELMEMESQS